ncbi:Hypothetical protein LUCI_0428 [Lucifera butyrica]|uniref:HTH lacI-type domain-containing protein n=1 Tax=Lucifera butyrica TaxID=1351585 RepID=A0A498R1J5_9FIRM|nr:LacI family DNA-binding transcriptional regulator [Lucifera butyrica]VBB05221.1 Hypothetical protein LUCI_0428 [Lucifera butyrica]
MSITTKDIARIANVSQSTVSRCLNNSPFASEKTKQRILKIAEEHGFQFNANARSLKVNKTYTIGLILPQSMVDHGFDVHSRAWQDTLIENLTQLQFDVIVSPSFGQSNIRKLIASQKVDGFIILQPELDIETMDYLEKSDIAYVFCKYLPDVCKNRDVDYVHADQIKGGYLAGEHLLKLGHKKILCISADVAGGEFKLRTEGCKGAFYDHNVPFNDKLLFFGDSTFTSGFQLIKKNVDLLKSITAIFAQNDLMALGVLSALRELHIKVPEDIAVVGYDNTELCTYFSPNLTSIHQPYKEIALLTCKRLIELLENKGDHVKQKLAIQPKLVVRESTGNMLP